MADTYHCKTCPVKKFIAKSFDLHWHDHEDCPYECPYAEKEGEENENRPDKNTD